MRFTGLGYLGEPIINGYDPNYCRVVCEPPPFEPIPIPIPAPIPEPAYVQPEPEYFELPYIPEPVYQAPEPIYQVPEPEFFELPYLPYVEPEPYIAPEPVYIPPASVQIAPEIMYTPPIELLYQSPAPIVEPFQVAEEEFFALPPSPYELAQEAPAVISTPAPASMLSGYMGCYADTSARDLPYRAGASGSMTIGNCQNLCAAAGYGYASVQYGGECWCGDSYGQYGPAVNCNMPCAGDPNEICGGKWAGSIYALPSPIVPEPISQPVPIAEPIQVQEDFFALPFIPEPVYVPPPAPAYIEPEPIVEEFFALPYIAPELEPIYQAPEPVYFELPYIPEPIYQEPVPLVYNEQIVAPVWPAEPDWPITPIPVPTSTPETFFQCCPCVDGGGGEFNGWGEAYGNGFLYQ